MPSPQPLSDLPPRLEQALEILYRIEGVAAARIWQWDDKVAVAVRSSGLVEEQLLTRVAALLSALALPHEQWEYGILVDE